MDALKSAIFPFPIGNTLFVKIRSNISELSVKLKFDANTNLNMQNSMVMSTFFRFWLEIPFWGKLGPKNQNCLFKLIFGTYRLIQICRIQWWLSLLPLLNGNTLSGKTWSNNQTDQCYGTHMEEIVLYWIQYKNSLKYKVGCYWRFSYVYKIN